MAARAIASLSLSFGLVSIPVKLYSATEQAAAIRFKLMGRHGVRLRQQYIADVPPAGEPWTELQDKRGHEQEVQRQAASAELRDPARGRAPHLRAAQADAVAAQHVDAV
jgi:hypothetical protein